MQIVAFGTSLSTSETTDAKTALSTLLTVPSMIIISIAGGAISVTSRQELEEFGTKITSVFMVHGTVHLGALPRTRPQLNTGLAAINKTTKIGFYYPTSLRRVQIRPKTSTNIPPYLYSRGPVRKPSTGSSKYDTTRKNAQRYYKTKRLISYLYSYMPSLMH